MVSREVGYFGQLLVALAGEEQPKFGIKIASPNKLSVRDSSFYPLSGAPIK